MRLFLSLLFLFISQVCFARSFDFYKETQAIKDIINHSIEVYQGGQNVKANKLVGDAYFQHFENMEGTIGRNVSGRKVFMMERKFHNLRQYYSDKADITKIKALIGSLFYDLDEVTPIIQNGFHLQAEASDTTYDKKAAEESSFKANQKREAEADAIFGAFDKAKNTSANVTAVAKDTIKKPQAKPNTTANSNTQNSLGDKLQMLYDEFSTKLDEAAQLFKEGKFEQASKLITSAQFDTYRNSKLKIAVNRYTKAGLNEKIELPLRNLVVKIDDKNLTEKELRQTIENVDNDLYTAMSMIPADKINDIIVKGYDKTKSSKDYSKVADDIKSSTDKILSDYQNKSKSALIDELQTTYLDLFEGTGMENKIGAVDNSLKLSIEGKFTEGVALIKSGASKDKLQQCFNDLNQLISGSLGKIQDSSPIFLLISAFTILLREGLEALIIVVAIVSYLIQSGNSKKLSIAYSALWTGVFLSFVTAFVIYYLFKQYAGQFRELLEGITFLIAVLLLLYVGFWLLHNARDKKWASDLKGQAMEAISSNSAKTLWITVFLAVYREGAETILFYQALFFDAKTNTDFSAIFGGLVLAIVLLVVIYYLLKAGAVRIPVKLFFKITSIIIFYMCVVFAGKGVAELAEGKIIQPTFLSDNLRFEPVTWLGLYPYYETIVPQIIVLALIIIGTILTKKFTSNKEGVKR